MRLIVLLLFCVSVLPCRGQQAIRLEVNSSQAKEGGGWLVPTQKNLLLAWSYDTDDYRLNEEIPGKIEVWVSADSLGRSDKKLLYRADIRLARFNYTHSEIPQKLPSGEYWIHTTFAPKDTQKHSPLAAQAQKLLLYEVDIKVKDVYLTKIKASEYSETVELHLSLALKGGRGTEVFGHWRASVGVYFHPIKEWADQTFYFDAPLPMGKDTLVHFSTPLFGFEGNKPVTTTLVVNDSYFEGWFGYLSPWSTKVAVPILTNVDQIVGKARENHPYLTYGEFHLPKTTKELKLYELLQEAKTPYRMAEQALGYLQRGNLEKALEMADSAMETVGKQRVSSMLYVSPRLISGLYSQIFKMIPSEDTPKNKAWREKVGFRLGHAMTMGDLMEGAKKNTSKGFLPGENLPERERYTHENVMGKALYWPELTLEALAWHIEHSDLEAADELVRSVEGIFALQEDLQAMLFSKAYTDSLWMPMKYDVAWFSDYVKFHSLRLRLFSAAGQYSRALTSLQSMLSLIPQSPDYIRLPVWEAAAHFYEATENFEQADSLLALVDAWWEMRFKASEKDYQDELFLQGHNRHLLAAKRGLSIPDGLSKSYEISLQRLAEKNAYFFFMDKVYGKPGIPQKAGFFRTEVYQNLYTQSLQWLRANDNFLAQADWLDEAGYMLGQEGNLKTSLKTYQVKFELEKINALVMRLSFGEESQVYWKRKQGQSLGRYLTYLQQYLKENGEDEVFSNAKMEGFTQVLNHHSFVLRSHYRMLYFLQNPQSEALQQAVVKWTLFREYMNKWYVEENPDRKGLEMFRQETARAEQDILRLSRNMKEGFTFDLLPEFKDIQARLKENEAAVEVIRYTSHTKAYYSDEPAYAAFVIRKDAPEPILLFADAEGADLENREYRFYKNSMRLQQENPRSYGRYWAWLEPALKGVEKVYFAADGVYHLINPATLVHPQTGRYLAQTQEVVFVSSLSSLPTGGEVAFSQVALFGNPEYLPGQPQKNTIEGEIHRAAMGKEPVPPLPGTEKEVALIAQIFREKGKTVKVYTGNQVTKREVFGANKAHILHLATHGYWVRPAETEPVFQSLFETMTGSGLLLASAQRYSVEEGYSVRQEGILTAAEIQDLHLFSTELVVLSACETGLGEVVPGEGIYGLKNALQKAGAKNMITSLWKVDDEATWVFMEAFYHDLIERGNVEEAYAKALTVTQNNYPHPYYWGAFVLTCNR
jgi:hypothetical protein